ncbi:hypothetical protein [Streptomyces sp. TE5632]
MTESTATEATATEAVARRLRLLADIVERKAVHPEPSYIDHLAADLRFAALTATTHPIEDGRRLPAETLEVLQGARDLMTARDFHLSPEVLGYATAPALGGMPGMKPLGAVSKKLASDDFELQKWRNTVLYRPHLDDPSDERVTWALAALAEIHYKHERLAVAVAASNDLPHNRGKTPYHLTVLHGYARRAAARARTHEGGKLIAALAEFGIPAFLAQDRGVTHLLVAVDCTTDEAKAHASPRVLISSGEHATRPADEHDEPWAGYLYDSDGEHTDPVFTAPSGLGLDEECAEAALRLARWLDAHGDRHARI